MQDTRCEMEPQDLLFSTHPALAQVTLGEIFGTLSSWEQSPGDVRFWVALGCEGCENWRVFKKMDPMGSPSRFKKPDMGAWTLKLPFDREASKSPKSWASVQVL